MARIGRLKLAAILLIASVTYSAAAADTTKMAAEFEDALHPAQGVLTDAEKASLVAAAVAYAPELAGNPRIAGTDQPIGPRSASGYYGGVYFGPLRVSDRRIDYLRLTIWGDAERGWQVDKPIRHSAVQLDSHPIWVWLEEPVTEQQAAAALVQLRDLAVTRTDGTALTAGEIDRVRRFDRHYATSFEVSPSDARPWYLDHYIVSAYSGAAGASPREFSAVALFAVVGEELRFIEVRRRPGR